MGELEIIEEEKKKVLSRFEAISQLFNKLLGQKRDEYIHMLDQ